jgi:hypothetical protein
MQVRNSTDQIVEDLLTSSGIESDHMTQYLSESVAAVSALAKILDKYGIEYTIIGALAVIAYNHVRMTEDMDVLIDKTDKKKLDDIPIGFLRKVSDKRFRLHDPRAKIDVIYSGEISGDGVHGIEFPSPREVSAVIHGINFIILPKLIEFKLSSGIYGDRLKDLADVQELIRANKLPEEYGDSFREDLKAKYREIWDRTKNYKTQGE